MTSEELEQHKKDIDAMTQEDMARLWRFAPGGHPYFVNDTELWRYFNSKFKGFTPELSKKIGW